MDYIGIFLSQAAVLLLMLIGMIIGDIAATSILGRLRGLVRQIIYLILFVIFLVVGNYIPSILMISNPNLYTSILLFSLWGFLSVFLSRLILYIMDTLTYTLIDLFQNRKSKNVNKNKDIQLDYKDIGSVLIYLKERFDIKTSEDILNKISKHKRGGKIIVNPDDLCSLLIGEGLSRDDILYILIKILKLSPEMAIIIHSNCSERYKIKN